MRILAEDGGWVKGVSKIVGVEGMTWGQSWERASHFTEIPSIVAGVRWGCRAGEERSDQGQMAFVPSYIYIWDFTLWLIGSRWKN